jgi:prophage regulatory protein
MKNKNNQPVLMLSHEIDTLVPYSRAHLYRLEDQGLFPRRKKIGPNRVAWLRTEVDEWLEKLTGDQS